MPTPVDDIKKVIHSLNERTKELNCLYQVDEILRDFSSSFENIILRLLKVIPESMQYGNICRATINYENHEYIIEPFKKTELKLSAQSFSNGKPVEISVYYIKPVKIEHRTIFLPEEQKLIQTLSEKIAGYIEYRLLREKLENKMAETSNKRDVPAGNLEKWLQSQHLNEKTIEQITRVKILFRKGETICKQGALTNHIMLLSEGFTKLYLESSHEKNYIFKLIKPFDFIGLSSLYGENTYTFSASALVPCSVYLIEKETLKNIFFENADFAYQAMKWYSSNFSMLLTKMSSIANKQSLGRMADVLLYLAKDIFPNNTIDGCISRKDIAELAGLSTESAVRILSDFKNDNIIAINRNEIQIINEELLRTISLAG